MTTCPAYEPALLDRAAGILDDDAVRRLESHLATCAACRAEADVLDRALSMAALPAPTVAERLAVSTGAGEAIRRMRSETRDRRFARGMIVAVAASAAFAVAVPLWLLTHHDAHRAANPMAAAGATHSEGADVWAPPDLDAVWAATAIATADDGGAGTTDVAGDDAATTVAAADEAPPMLFAEIEEIDFDYE